MGAIAVNEHFVDGALRILSGDAYDQEQIIAQQNGTNDQVYVKGLHVNEDGSEDEYYISMDRDATQQMIQKAKDSMASAKKEQEKRAKSCGIAVKKGGNVTKPSKYSEVPDDKESWLDWTNYRYPVDDSGHVKAAASYMGQEKNKSAGGYSDTEWTSMESHLEKRKKALGIGEESGGTSKGEPGQFERKSLSQQERATEFGIAIKKTDAVPPDHLAQYVDVPDAWADPTNFRFSVADDAHARASLKDWANTLRTQPGLYTADEQALIMDRLTEALVSNEKHDKSAPAPVTKDIGQTFDEYLDSALDQALVSAIDSIYYAFVKAYVGTSYYWSGSDQDPDSLTREEFSTLCQKVATAFMAIYDKLADDEGGGDPGVSVAKRLSEMFAMSVDTVEKGAQSRMVEKLTEPDFVAKSGVHSEQDGIRQLVIHRALEGMGWVGCIPAGTSESDKSQRALDEGLKAASENGLSGALAESIVKAVLERATPYMGVTGSGETGPSEEPNTPDKPVQKHLDPPGQPATVPPGGERATSEAAPPLDDEKQKLLDLQARRDAVEAEIKAQEDRLATVNKELAIATRVPGENPLDKVEKTPEGQKPVPSDEDRPVRGPNPRARFKQLPRR